MATQQKKVAFHTMGCKLNFSETSTIKRDFISRGFKTVSFNEYANIYVLNSCSVTENADREARKIIRQAKRLNPNSSIIVTGCYAQLKPKELAAIKEVDMIFGAKEKFNLLDHLDSIELNHKTRLFHSEINSVSHFESSFSSNDRTRSYLKVQDGCDYNCTFCTIPLARGVSRSSTVSKTLTSAKHAISSGAREIVLTGVNIGDFGVNSQEKFIDLLFALNDLNDLDRIRISSIEPNLLSNEIIEFCAKSKKIMPHFHIPLQSGSSRILKLMRRKYQTSLYRERIQHIKSLIPDACIGADIIVGFPSETDDDFQKSYDFIESLNISYLHVFSYSERQNTKAIKIKNKVSKTKKAERSLEMRELSKELKVSFEKSFVGSTREVLFEYQIDNQWFGHTDNYLPVRVNTKENLKNSIESVNIVNSVKNYLVGSFLN
ncbi:MAG: tRNA (N(6)-L-threonylcarbamoyladenosine(37)-C(2))-methylthiotransferase MtaB [bacterium TMED144]|nr:MAG: tRNA (N(6)-L-threonylcarbamoyladenosine(37)-C(2))-methylthiotransferase MtaB [bacterium TMED144]|tara:strand:+ start:899 stop:2197 length:1299 start_codon:yes stop_codon:yes gene_type:complete